MPGTNGNTTKGLIKVKAKNIQSNVSGDYRVDASNIYHKAMQTFQQKSGKGKAVVNGDKEERKPRANFEIEEIQLISDNLEDGFGPTKSEVIKGMIYGKRYRFKITKYKNNLEPLDKRCIKWSYSFKREDGASIPNTVGGIVNIGQEEMVLHIEGDVDVCGRTFTVYAYIQNKENGAKLNTWVHYRFRWFSRETVKDEVTNRTTNVSPRQGAFLVNQGSTSLCGMACIFYLLAKQSPELYKNTALDLHRKGIVKCNSYLIEPSSTLMYEMNPSSPKYPSEIPGVDWMLMASTRNKESDLGYTGEAYQDASAINWPSILVKLKKKLLGYNDVVDNTDFFMNPISTDKLAWLVEMQKAYQEGYNISILIDSDMLFDKPTHFMNTNRWHWIVYEGDLYVDKESKEYSFSYWCWGEPPKQRSFRTSVFNTNYYGYIKGK